MSFGKRSFPTRPYSSTDIEGFKSTPQLSSGMRLDIRTIEEGGQDRVVKEIITKIRKEGVFTLDFDKDGRWFGQVVLFFDRNIKRLGIAALEYPLSSMNSDGVGVIRLQQSSDFFNALNMLVQRVEQEGLLGRRIRLGGQITNQERVKQTIEELRGRWRLYMKNVQDDADDIYASDLIDKLGPWITNCFIPDDAALRIMMGENMFSWLSDPREKNKEAVFIEFNKRSDVIEYIFAGYPDIRNVGLLNPRSSVFFTHVTDYPEFERALEQCKQDSSEDLFGQCQQQIKRRYMIAETLPPWILFYLFPEGDIRARDLLAFLDRINEEL